MSKLYIVGSVIVLLNPIVSSTIVDIQGGATSTVYLFSDGKIKTTSTPPTDNNAAPSNVGTGNKVTAIAVGDATTCVIVSPSNDAVCWGFNDKGQRGVGNVDYSAMPTSTIVPVDFGSGKQAIQIVGGAKHFCALLDTINVKCWGYNELGQLGLGDDDNRGDDANEMGTNLPLTDVVGTSGLTITSIHSGCIAHHTCALLSDKTMKCWGSGMYGQLGITGMANKGDNANEMGDDLPTADLGTGEKVAKISIGHGHTCVILESGDVKCLGFNYYGQLNLGDNNSRGDQPNELGDNLANLVIHSTKKIVKFACGQYFTCAVLEDNKSVKCWGKNDYGQLGYGDATQRGDTMETAGTNISVVDLGVDLTITHINAGEMSACVLFSNNKVKCWGRNDLGQLGYTMGNIGDAAGEMGSALPFLALRSGTSAPSKAPITVSPTSKSPSNVPTSAPTRSPTHVGETISPSKSPSKTPTKTPTTNPTTNPTPKEVDSSAFKSTQVYAHAYSACAVALFLVLLSF